MISWILGKAKWLLLVAMVGGPVAAYFGYSTAAEMKDVLAKGQDATAAIEGGAVRKGRRSGTSYSIDLQWTDKSGARQSADKVPISAAMADQIIVGDKLVRDAVKIKYLAGTPQAKPIILEDVERQIRNNEEMVPFMIGAGVLGAIGSAFLFMWGRRRVA